MVDALASHQELISSRRAGRALEGRMAARRERDVGGSKRGDQPLRLGNAARRVARGREVGPRKPESAVESRAAVCTSTTARQRCEASSRAQTNRCRDRGESDALRDFEDGVEGEADSRRQSVSVLARLLLDGPRQRLARIVAMISRIQTASTP